MSREREREKKEGGIFLLNENKNNACLNSMSHVA